MRQPFFGQRLKELRRERGLSQAALAGDEISTGYLSRLESGARQPTERIASYLAGKLQVSRAVFDEPSGNGRLSRALSIASSSDGEEVTSELIEALGQADDHEDPVLRWQALWLVAHYWQRQGNSAEEQSALEKLVRIADELGTPELQCRSWTRLARFLRTTGELPQALGLALKAWRLAKDAQLHVTDIGRALLVVVSIEAESGRLPDARVHADELIELTEGRSDALQAEALWSAAQVAGRQGDHEVAKAYLERAVDVLTSLPNLNLLELNLWVRLRLAAASTYLRSSAPNDLSHAQRFLREAEQAMDLVGTPLLRQELLTLQAHLAFAEGRSAQARAMYDQLSGPDLRLTYRDRLSLRVLDSRLLILEGHQEQGFRQLKELAEEAREASNIDLSAEIWRVLAESLEIARKSGPGT